ncbi:MAG: hypothetical protein Q4F54_02700 [Coriobacteriia bacterium]|nr:hypothetical protein [Coriobacteriia bacterium]
MRLAGIYQDSDGFIAEIAKEALSRKQSDYGAFLAYEAFLLDHHINLDRENVYKGIYDANNSTNNSSDNSKKKN